MGFNQDKLSSTALAEPEQEFQSEALTLVDRAQFIVVSNQQEFEQAVEFGKGVSAFIKKVEAFFKPLKATAKAAHKALCDKENEILAIPTRANEIAQRAANTWKTEQKRRDDEARRIEQARLQKEAEEAQAKLLREIKKTGNKEALEQAKNIPLEVPQAAIEPGFQKVAGTRNMTVWLCEVENADLVPRDWCIPDEKRIREHIKIAQEKALPGAQFAIPGVRVWKEERTSW
jgi:hypothetical protein